MKIIINSQIIIQNPSNEIKEFCKNNLIIKNPEIQKKQMMGFWTGNVVKTLKMFSINDGNYILNKDATSRWGYTLFGKDVYTSENMPEMAAGNRAILYGDMSGLAVKISETMNIEVLREKYATQHAIGVVAWMELDSKVENSQKITGLTMA